MTALEAFELVYGPADEDERHIINGTEMLADRTPEARADIASGHIAILRHDRAIKALTEYLELGLTMDLRITPEERRPIKWYVQLKVQEMMREADKAIQDGRAENTI